MNKNKKLYQVWCSMKGRCYNPNNKSYQDYGGRGITLGDGWLTYYNFQRDMLPGYQEGLSIDRINNDGIYSLDNCRWATAKEQNRNKRDNLKIKINGETRVLADVADELGMKRATIASRFRRGATLEVVLSTEIDKYKKSQQRLISYAGLTMSLSAWARKIGVNRTTLRNRLNVWNWSIDRALTTNKNYNISL